MYKVYKCTYGLSTCKNSRWGSTHHKDGRGDSLIQFFRCHCYQITQRVAMADRKANGVAKRIIAVPLSASSTTVSKCSTSSESVSPSSSN
mmetsp:Transcript_568/g.1062  ORF Transcript_568/g.1062 Transcript_568/m.1062 type:complete len:90 (+) Transcript_568:306-575(+)